ncbi:lipopolysaccharide biosynthesis protein [Acinetobacter sp.]|uniref:lipopolysaccharide biosynthesis protein n=1 Tax=Acinetobacter sp. TaxID=472 RepID=UPI003CFD4ED2
MTEITKKQFIGGAFWKIVEQFSTKGVSMLISVILARILMPEDYGIIALTALFTNLSDVLIDGGFSTALIRKEKVDEYDYGCVFFISMSIAALLYVILFFAAPFVSAYYSEPIMTTILRVIGLTFFIQGFSSTRTAVVTRNMHFKFLFYCNTTANLISGIAGIIAAYLGMGVWALVIQRLSQQALATLLLFIKIRWKIKWCFGLQRLNEILNFSLGVVGSSLLNYLGGSIFSAVIGKQYSVTNLGYYDKGAQLPMQMSLYTFGSMSSVLLPTISSCQKDLARVKAIIRKVVKMTAYLIMPMMLGMMLVSRELIILLFTEKWLPAVPIMQYSCIYYLATPFMLINVQVFFALGRSELRIKTELLRLGLMISGVLIFGIWLNCGIDLLALVNAIIAILTAMATFLEVKKMIHYSGYELLHDVWKPFSATALMGSVIYVADVWIIDPFSTLPIASLTVKFIIGAGVYLLLSAGMKMDGYLEIIGALSKFSYKGKPHE